MNKRINTVTITVSGPQGSGKSRVAEIVFAALQAQGVAVTLSDGGRTPQKPMRMAPNSAAAINVEQN